MKLKNLQFKNLKLLGNLLFLALVVSQISLTAQAQICSQEKPPAFQSSHTADDESVKEKVRRTLFDGGGKTLPADLSKLKASILPYLAVYFENKDEKVRLKAVKIAGSTRSKEALPLLSRALEDDSAAVSNAAAETLYADYEQSDLAEQNFIENSLCRSIEKGSNAAASFLLLSRFVNNPQVEKVLAFRAESPTQEKTKFYSLQTPVSVSFIIKMAWSEVGGRTPRREFRQAIGEAALPELAFSVWAMQELGDYDLLHALRRTLPDKRKIRYENEKGVIVSRRLRDVAIEKFVQRLKLKPPFKIVKGKIYSEAEARRLNALIYEKIPQS